MMTMHKSKNTKTHKHTNILPPIQAWPTERTEKTELSAVMTAIDLHLKIGECFDTSGQRDPAEGDDYRLLAMICFYGRHYMAFTCSTETGTWTFFDDAHIRQVC